MNYRPERKTEQEEECAALQYFEVFPATFISYSISSNHSRLSSKVHNGSSLLPSHLGRSNTSSPPHGATRVISLMTVEDTASKITLTIRAEALLVVGMGVTPGKRNVCLLDGTGVD